MHNSETDPLLSKPPPYKPSPHHTQGSSQTPIPNPGPNTPPKPSISRLKKLEQLNSTLQKYKPVLPNLFQFMVCAAAIFLGMVAVVVVVVGGVGTGVYVLYQGVKMALRS